MLQITLKMSLKYPFGYRRCCCTHSVRFSLLFSSTSSTSSIFPFLTKKFLKTLIFWKSAGRLLCRMTLTLGLSDASRVEPGYEFLAGLPEKWCCVLCVLSGGAWCLFLPLPVMLIVNNWLCLQGFSAVKLISILYLLINEE